jgi:hypothetical protein
LRDSLFRSPGAIAALRVKFIEMVCPALAVTTSGPLTGRNRTRRLAMAAIRRVRASTPMTPIVSIAEPRLLYVWDMVLPLRSASGSDRSLPDTAC